MRRVSGLILLLTLTALACGLLGLWQVEPQQSPALSEIPSPAGQEAIPTQTVGVSPTAPAEETLLADKWSLWANGTRLRGANIYQRRVYPELDGDEFLGSGAVGPPYTQDDLDRLAQLGANCIIVSHPGLFSESPPYTVDTHVQDNLDRLLAMAARADLCAVISFRTGPGRSEFSILREGAGVWFDPSFINDAVWQGQAAQDGWAAMWRYTADRYRNNPVVAGYDLMVEPNSNEAILGVWEPQNFYPQHAGKIYDWNRFYPRLVAAVRQVDPETPILVGGLGYSAAHWLPYLIPVPDPHIVYTIHQYAPMVYTHQEPPLALSYPGRFDGDEDGVEEQVDRDWLAGQLAAVDEFKQANQVVVAVTEFGAMRWEPGVERYILDQASLFEERGWNYAVWQWFPAWKPLAEGDNSFNFRFGPDPKQHVDIENGLLNVFIQLWGRNTVRPSNLSHD
jgi:hypothetical protein